MTEVEALAFVIHISDALRVWSVPGAFLGIVMLSGITWKLGRLLLGLYLAKSGMRGLAAFVAVEGHTADSVMEPAPRFWAISGALVFMLAIFVAGTIIPSSRSGFMESYLMGAFDLFGLAWMGADTAWRLFLLLAWGLWSVGCWVIVIAFSPNPKPMICSAAVLGVGAYFLTADLGGPLT